MEKTKKEMYIDKMANQLKEWSANIDELERKLDGTRTDMKTALDIRIHEIRYKREELGRKLQELRDSSGSAWETMKGGMESAWNELAATLTEARNKFRKSA